MRQRRELERLWDSHLRNTLQNVLTGLHENAVQPIALKGPVLAERLYEDPSARRSTDLDLLVSPADIEHAISALDRLGYQAESGASAGYHQRFHHHWVLSHPQRPQLELHFRLYVNFGVHIEASDFLARAYSYQTRDGANCYVLSPEDEFFYLSLHAAGHSFARLAWLHDLKLFLRRYPALRWPEVFQRADALGVRSALDFAGKVLQERLEVCLPNLEVHSSSRQRLAWKLLALSDGVPESSARWKLFSLFLQAALCDRTVTGVRFVQHHLGRAARRALQRRLPWLVPQLWEA